MVEKEGKTPTPRLPEEIINEILGKGARDLKRRLTGLVGDWVVAEKPKQRREALKRLRETAQEEGVGAKRAAQIMELHSTLVAQHTARRAERGSAAAIAEPAEPARPPAPEPAPPPASALPPERSSEEPPRPPEAPLPAFSEYISNPDYQLPYQISRLPELRGKVDLSQVERIKARDDDGEVISFIDPQELKTMDQVALIIMEQIADAVKRTQTFGLRDKKIIETYLTRAKEIAFSEASKDQDAELDPRYVCLHSWYDYARDFQELIYEGLLSGEEGISKSVDRMSSVSKTGARNPAIIFFLRDPGIARAFLELRGILGDGVFISGGAVEQTLFGEEVKVVVKGGSFGAAEKIGYHLHWATGNITYDGIGEAGEKVYPQMQIHYLAEYLYTRGPYEMLQVLIDPETRREAMVELMRAAEEGREPDEEKLRLGFREILPFPTMWHDQSQMAQFWIDNFSVIGLNNQGRILSLYGERDRRKGAYSIEEFERASPDEKRTMVAKALYEVEGNNRLWREVISNNLIRVRRRVNLYLSEEGRVIGKRDKQAGANEFLAPLLDFQERNEEGNLIIDFSRLDYTNFGTGGQSDLLSRFFVYEGYAFNSFKTIAELVNPKSEKTLFQKLDALASSEMLKHMLGEKDPETGEFKGALYLRNKLIGEIIDYYSEMILMTSLWETRRKGARTPLAVQINQLLDWGLFRGYYRTYDFEAAGIYGVDYSNMSRAPLGAREKLALVLNRFSDREVWEGSFLEGEIPFEALAAYAGYRRMREYKQMHREGVRVNYVEFAFQDEDFPDDSEKRQWKEIGPKTKVKVGNEERLLEDYFPEIQGKLTHPLYSILYNAVEKADIDRFIHCSLVDTYLTNTWERDPKNRVERRWWVPLDFYQREKELNWIIRRQKYASGKGRGGYITDQLEIERNRKEGPRTHIIEGEEVPIIKRDNLDNFEGIAYFNEGLDKLFSLLQGAGAFHPGCKKRLTPLYLFYDPTRQRNLVLSLFASATFALEARRNTGKNWEDDQVYLRIANVKKLSDILDLIESQAGVDSDVIRSWKTELGVEPNLVDDFEALRREHRIPNYEGKVDPSIAEEEVASSVEQWKNIIVKTVPGAELATGFLKRMRASRIERRVVIRGAAVGAAVVGVPIFFLGGALAGSILAAAGIGLLVGAPLGGNLVWDRGEEGRSMVRVGNDFMGLLGQRIRKRSPEVLVDGEEPLWDDAVPAEPVAKIYWVDPMQALARPALI